ncbi:pilin [Patescibacteria group bacterium]|nr:pilin [Patescibacteria group bacterium]
MKFLSASIAVLCLLLNPALSFAATTNSEITAFTNQTLNTLLIFATAAATFFLVRGGYVYITSTGKPDALEHAKKTVRNALIGLVIIIAASVFSSVLQGAFDTPSQETSSAQLNLAPIQPVEPSGGLTQVLLDAVAGFLQNIVQSATEPLTDGIITFLTTTPSILTNSVIFNFWLVMVGITDSLFALMIALLGFHFMSASTFGFEEIEFKHLLPRVGLAFLGANMSIFLCDWIVLSCNTLVTAVLNATGGLNSAWIQNAFTPASIVTGATPLIIFIFMILFVIVSIVLLLFYVTRLIAVALGAVMSPLIFLLWAVPKFADFAEVSVKSYITVVYTVFVHVVIIQLASSFLTIPGSSGANSLISILVGIGLLFTLLKTPSIMMQLVFYNTGRGVVRKIGGQIMNVISSSSKEASMANKMDSPKTTPRKAVAA